MWEGGEKSNVVTRDAMLSVPWELITLPTEMSYEENSQNLVLFIEIN